METCNTFNLLSKFIYFANYFNLTLFQILRTLVSLSRFAVFLYPLWSFLIIYLRSIHWKGYWQSNWVNYQVINEIQIRPEIIWSIQLTSLSTSSIIEILYLKTIIKFSIINNLLVKLNEIKYFQLIKSSIELLQNTLLWLGWL